MSWNTCQYEECESYTARPDGELCETHRRSIAKETNALIKANEKKNRMVVEAKIKATAPRAKPNKVSEKRKELNKEYFALVEQFKKDNPECKAKVNGYCTTNTDDPHHSRGRGVYLLDVSTWIPVCRSCHIWIGSNHAAAIEKGLIYSRLTTTEPHKI